MCSKDKGEGSVGRRMERENVGGKGDGEVRMVE